LTTVLCDLDGVVYRGSRELPGAGGALLALAAAGVTTLYITNNSTRTPEATAEKISRVTGVEVHGDQVLTSSQAAMTLLGPDDGAVLVVGEAGLRAAVLEAGLTVSDEPHEAGAVVVGLTRSLSYQMLADAMKAIGNGARFVATNDDATFPTEDGLEPGCGAIVAAIATASGVEPEIAGKPNPAMRDLIRSRASGDVWVIGDRPDTDIALASGEPGWRSILVLTGITGSDEAADAGADFVVDDLASAVEVVLGHVEES
jgi:HAD superfamily hydrolase (TIGR01450 family)